MIRNKRKILTAALAAALLLAGCGAVEESKAPAHPSFVHGEKSSSAAGEPEASSAAETSAQSEESKADIASAEVTSEAQATSAAETTAAETQTSSSEAEAEESQSEEPSSDKYEIDSNGHKQYIFSDKYESFIDGLTFVGDSICYGLEVYDYLAPDNVLAFGSVAARNIFDFTFDVNGVEYGIIDAVKLVNPKTLIFSMGMNDINLTTSEQYCENYMDLLDQVHAAVPSAKLYVASITPISNTSDFNDNATIDSYNAAIKSFLANSGKGYGYVDIASYLKDKWNGLAYEYSGGDGIHLQSSAYSAILYQVCEQLCK